jgi:hypothetical protein
MSQDGGSSLQGGGSVLREQEAEAACREENERWQGCDNRDDMTTSWQKRGQREGRHLQTRGGGSSRGQEEAAVRQKASQQSSGGTSGQEAMVS